MVEDTEENLAKCICGNCPSQNECMNNNKELLYCAKGKSGCTVAQKGCVCGACPITSEYKLNGFYYCVKGEA